MRVLFLHVCLDAVMIREDSFLSMLFLITGSARFALRGQARIERLVRVCPVDLQLLRFKHACAKVVQAIAGLVLLLFGGRRLL